MDFNSDIAAMAVTTAQSKVEQVASTKIMKMAMQQENLELEAIQDMAPPASALNPAGVGQNVDFKA
ncbi:MAG: YjfB family protein [Clostridia bacterium]|nr:YjfB family protein [Clostridia bacterium]